MVAQLDDVILDMSRQVIRTKVHAPVTRRLVPRDGLIETLPACLGPKLTLVCAPAGWGKSSLLAAWAAADALKRPFAWFAVDETDNDPVTFWTYVIEALRGVEPSLGGSALALLRSPGTGLVDLAVAELINDLSALASPVVLTVDDYHLIRKPEIHRSMAFLIERLPNMVHVAIATRAEPDLPIAKLRARGEVVEIDTAALRFSDDEAERFLNELLDLGLSHDDVHSLRDRTEGWAAGLYLAALSLRTRQDRHQFIAEFAGDDRHIVDYLGTEVLASQDGEVRRFLLRTSVLERLCAPLCDAVTGTDGSDGTLRALERSNLFLLPLDTKREWYRYHHLFRDLLRRELQLAEGDLVADLHSRAAKWLLGAGQVSEAIHHTILAGDLDWAYELIAAHSFRFLGVGDDPTIASWLEALPGDALFGDARVCVAGALVWLIRGRLAEAERWLAKAQQADAPGAFMDGGGSLAAATAYASAGHRLGMGALTEARSFAMEAANGLIENSVHHRMARALVGVASYLLGHVEESIDALNGVLRGSPTRSAELPDMHALGWLASIRADLGQWDEAEELASSALAVGAGLGAEEHWTYGLSLGARGKVRQRRGLIEEAGADFSRSAQLLRRGLPLFLAYALPTYASFKHSCGQKEETGALIREAQSLVEAFPDPGILVQLVEKTQRRLRLVPSCPAIPFVDEVSARELSVLRLLPSTLSQREIASQLYVSMNTVKSHTKSIFRKLGVSTRAEAVTRARDLQLI